MTSVPLDTSMLPQMASFPVAGRAQPPYDAGQDDLPGGSFSVRVIRGDDFLANATAEVEPWRRLAVNALEPNVFYEPDVCLSALEAWGTSHRVDIMVIEAARRKWPEGPRVWCGFFPIVRWRHAGQRCLSMWRHEHCYLTTPLLRTEVAGQTLACFLGHLAGLRPRAPLLRLEMTPGEGPFHKLLVELLHEQQLGFTILDRYTRAFFVRHANNEQFLQHGLSRKRRHELKRQLRRLDEQIPVTFRRLAQDEPLEPWMDGFLQLESAGWKRSRETALACRARDAHFFRQTLRRSHAAGQLMMLAMYAGERLVAMKCNLLTVAGGFAFKIAYDESFAEYSPGALLEMENIRCLHDQPTPAWMDSCAMPDHSLINPLWPDRRIMQTMLVSAGDRRGELTVAATPLLKWLRGCIWPPQRSSAPRKQHLTTAD